MDIFFTINYVKFFFASITLGIVILGALVNLFEPCLPTFLAKALRYGKFASTQESTWFEKLEVPKSAFKHFYFTAVVIYYPLVLNEVIRVYVGGHEVHDWFRWLLDIGCGRNRTASESATRVFTAILLLTLQTGRRFYETHFVSVFSKKAKINLSQYIVGMLYYLMAMLAILCEAPQFATSATKTQLTLSDLTVLEVSAVALFLWAWYHQHATTVILANLRKNKKGKVVSEKYQIPQGDWFDYLSSPHSTAEILMYLALTILLYRNVTWWFVFGWVICNQVETILLSHWWYQDHFREFPKSKKALIPFVY